MFARHIQARLSDALGDAPVVLLNGPRQSGKSTLVQALAVEQGRRYMTLDDRVVLAAAKADPLSFLSALEGPVVLDEVQRAPDLFLDLKALVDRDRQPGRFLLTGSANVLLLPKMADSLAGRMEVLTLWPLSGGELANDASFNRADALWDDDMLRRSVPPCDRAELVMHLTQGGFPEMVARTSARRRQAWVDAYLDTLLQRDVRDLAQIDQVLELPPLLKLLAARSGGLSNLAELSRSLALPLTTLRRYFGLLQTLFLVLSVPAWSRNATKRLIKTPKVFLSDTGLMSGLNGWTGESLQDAAGLPGSLVETYVATQLARHLSFSERGLSLWHYRSQAGQEVDFVLEDRQGRLVGIEVKASATVSAHDFKGLRHLQETEPERFSRGYVMYAGREVVAFSPQLVALPLSWWWAHPVP
jgi:uncharacterized protein